MTVHFRNLLLKDQAITCYRFAGMTAAHVPKKRERTILADPNQRVQIIITRSEHKSTYGKPLYLCEHSYY